MIQLVYASTSGNVEAVVENIADILNGHGFETVQTRSETTDIAPVKKHKRFVFATSTWEHGKLNPFFEKLLSQMQTENFQGKQAAFVGLGDRRYEPLLFCEGMEIIRKLWLKNGGEEVCTPLKIEGEPYEQLKTNVVPWANVLASSWSNYYV